MNKYVKTFFTFIGVWFVASALNGLLTGICIAVSEPGTFNGSPGVIFLACIFSFLLSIPLVGLVWLVTTIAQANGHKGHSLFQIILSTTLFCAVMGALFFINAFGDEFKEVKYVAAVCIIVSAISAVLTFRNQLKTHE